MTVNYGATQRSKNLYNLEKLSFKQVVLLFRIGWNV